MKNDQDGDEAKTQKVKGSKRRKGKMSVRDKMIGKARKMGTKTGY